MAARPRLMGAATAQPDVRPTTTLFSFEDFSKADRWVATIAIWQIFGGAFSIAAFLDALRQPTSAPGLRGVVVTAGIAVALFAILSGLRLRKRRTSAIHQALVVQALQLVGFSSGSMMVQLTLGPYVYLTLLWGRRYTIGAGVRPSIQFHLDSAGSLPPGVAINLLAAFCFMRLLFWELPTSEPARGRASAPAPTEPPSASGDAAA